MENDKHIFSPDIRQVLIERKGFLLRKREDYIEETISSMLKKPEFYAKFLKILLEDLRKEENADIYSKELGTELEGIINKLETKNNS